MGFCTICDLLLQVPSSPHALSFPLAPEPPSWGRRGEQIFSHRMPPCSRTQGLHLCRSCPPRAAPSLLDAVEWESSFWEMLCSALAATGAQSRVGGVGLSPSHGRCCSMGTDWLSAPCHRGMAPGGVGVSGGERWPVPGMPACHPRPPGSVTHSPSGSSHAAACRFQETWEMSLNGNG